MLPTEKARRATRHSVSRKFQSAGRPTDAQIIAKESHCRPAQSKRLGPLGISAFPPWLSAFSFQLFSLQLLLLPTFPEPRAFPDHRYATAASARSPISQSSSDKDSFHRVPVLPVPVIRFRRTREAMK